jgi:ribosomal protein L18E
MRSFSKLDVSRQARFTRYVAENVLVPSKTLAEDLGLHPQTIAAIKASISRRHKKGFNDILSERE